MTNLLAGKHEWRRRKLNVILSQEICLKKNNSLEQKQQWNNEEKLMPYGCWMNAL